MSFDTKAVDKPAIEINHVSKFYKIYPNSAAYLLEALTFAIKKKHDVFCALNDVSFSLPYGKTIGIVGRNGSGKSTILKIIASVLKPTSGHVKVNGKIAALLELGTGFNPDFTGRENIVLNCTLMGLSKKQIKQRLPSIEAFAGIGKFLDYPFKTYSSGMQMRLAFATAIHVDPDILIVDEALAVGDARFQQKCFKKFDDLQKKGKTILLVTHDMQAIPRYCDEAILLHKGQLIHQGSPKEIVELYSELLLTGELPQKDLDTATEDKDNATNRGEHNSAIQAKGLAKRELAEFLKDKSSANRLQSNPLYNPDEYRFGDKSAEILDVMVVSEEGINKPTLLSAQTIDIYMKVLFHTAMDLPVIGLTLKTVDGVLVHGCNSRLKSVINRVEAGSVHIYKMSLSMSIHDGDWFMELGVANHHEAVDIPADIRTAALHFSINYSAIYDGLTDLGFSILECSADA